MSPSDGHSPGDTRDDLAGRCAEPLARPARVVYDLSGTLFIRLTPTGERTHAVVVGEVDFASAPTLERALSETLRQRPRGVDLDLGEVGFFDCAGLNVLLRARRLARRGGATFTVSAVGPAVARLLTLTGSHGLFGPGTTERSGPTAPPRRPQAPPSGNPPDRPRATHSATMAASLVAPALSVFGHLLHTVTRQGRAA